MHHSTIHANNNNNINNNYQPREAFASEDAMDIDPSTAPASAPRINTSSCPGYDLSYSANSGHSSPHPLSHHQYPSSPNIPVNVDDMTVNQLKSTLKALQLPIYGCKQALRQRLLMGASPKSRSCTTNNSSNNNSVSVASTYSGSTFPLFEQTPTSRNSSVSANMQSLNLMDTSTTSSIAECKLVELRERCKYFGLPTSGRKQEVVDRLEAYYEKALLTDLIPGNVGSNPEHNTILHESSNCFSTGGGSFDEQHDVNAEEFNWRNELPESETRSTPVPVLAMEMSNFSQETTSISMSHSSSPVLSTSANNTWDRNDIATVAYQGKLEMRTILDLREACKKLGLRVAGKKADVISRLYEYFKMKDEFSMNGIHHQHAMQPIPESKHNNLMKTDLAENNNTKRKRMKVENDDSGDDSPTDDQPQLNTHQTNYFQESHIKSRLRSNSKTKFSKHSLPKMYLMDDSCVDSVWTCVVLSPENINNDTNVVNTNNMISHCVRIGQAIPTCDCDESSTDSKNTFLNPCKHLLFVFLKILQFTCEDNLFLVNCNHALNRMKHKDTFVEGNSLCNICFDSCEQDGKGVHEECMHQWYLFKNRDSIARCKGKRNRMNNNGSLSCTSNEVNQQ